MRTLKTARPIVEEALREALGLVPPFTMAWTASSACLAHVKPSNANSDPRSSVPVTLRLSSHYWRDMPDHERRCTLRHEAMHIADIWENGLRAVRYADSTGHGASWQAFMLRIGETPEPKASHALASTLAVAAFKRMIAGTCPCASHLIEPKRARYLRENRLSCRYCGQRIHQIPRKAA